MKSDTRQVARHAERAILVAVLLPERQSMNHDDPLGELSSLAETAGVEIVDRLIQNRKAVHPGCYIGRGKAEELAELVEAHEADTVIFDNDLSPAQIREIEDITTAKVLDRSELILDIFARRARTRQAMLQVELAQLEYTYPRLRRMWTHLERIAGAGGGSRAGAVGGVGTRGPGETQIETDRRLVRKRISDLKAELRKIDDRKLREVKSRHEQFTVCLVGYTNAGKSTLLNTLTNAGVTAEDRLFATLDTKTRRWDLGDGLEALLSDTVGFVRDLPHHLVASFKATLEEAVHADLLLHVVDASHPQALQQVEAVHEVLEQLDCHEKNRLTLLNKADVGTDEALMQLLTRQCPDPMIISARTGVGLDVLVREVRHRLGCPAVQVDLRADCADGKLLTFLTRHATINTRTYEGSTVCMSVTMSRHWLPRIADRVEILSMTAV